MDQAQGARVQPPQPGSVGHREEMNVTFPQLGHFKNAHRAELQVCNAFFSTKKVGRVPGGAT